MGISRDRAHKHRSTGGKRVQIRKKRKFELGRPAANTKLSQGTPARVRTVRTRGGNIKFRALRLDHGNFSWGSERRTQKARIIDVIYNASNNELVRTKTLVKNAIVLVDASPFRLWYENHYAVPLGRKHGTKITDIEGLKIGKKRMQSDAQKTLQEKAAVDPLMEEQFATGRLKACISSRPGQCGRCDGYILEGKELEFYSRKIKARKGK
ncbi:40S ribosomal protein S8-like [Tropilaelaps mercedesae]|uniref:40S ribosomal protein S8 n=1 Tax=Tropilaelaps mercedesae TaxID=418985 RepID=A0A1V9Y0S0_9ACAR|nr:40S ribosomal protein S8-like [Tropilaelaps mercedesae]